MLTRGYKIEDGGLKIEESKNELVSITDMLATKMRAEGDPAALQLTS